MPQIIDGKQDCNADQRRVKRACGKAETGGEICLPCCDTGGK